MSPKKGRFARSNVREGILCVIRQRRNFLPFVLPMHSPKTKAPINVASCINHMGDNGEVSGGSWEWSEWRWKGGWRSMQVWHGPYREVSGAEGRLWKTDQPWLVRLLTPGDGSLVVALESPARLVLTPTGCQGGGS